MKYIWRNYKPMIIVGSLVIGLIILGIFSENDCLNEKVDLVKQCEQAGQAHYECEAKFQSYCKSNTAYVPVYVYGGK